MVVQLSPIQMLALLPIPQTYIIQSIGELRCVWDDLAGMRDDGTKRFGFFGAWPNLSGRESRYSFGGVAPDGEFGLIHGEAIVVTAEILVLQIGLLESPFRPLVNHNEHLHLVCEVIDSAHYRGLFRLDLCDFLLFICREVI